MTPKQIEIVTKADSRSGYALTHTRAEGPQLARLAGKGWINADGEIRRATDKGRAALAAAKKKPTKAAAKK